MEPITIEYNKGDGFIVRQGAKYADFMCWDEMMGLLTTLTLPDDFKYYRQNWMKTEAQHRKSEPWRYRDKEDNTKGQLLLEVK